MSSPIQLALAVSIAFAVSCANAGHFGQTKDIIAIAKDSTRTKVVAKKATAAGRHKEHSPRQSGKHTMKFQSVDLLHFISNFNTAVFHL